MTYPCSTFRHTLVVINRAPWAPSHYPKRRLFVRSRKVSKSRDLHLDLSDRSEIWQALRQQCCRRACQISKRYDNLKYRSRGFETSRDLTKIRLFGYWDGALVFCVVSTIRHHKCCTASHMILIIILLLCFALVHYDYVVICHVIHLPIFIRVISWRK